jgi:2-iminoacetate synthase
MSTTAQNAGLRNLPEELHHRKRIILGELKDRTLWFVRLRWWVPPSIAAGSGVAWLIGVDFSALALLGVAGFILAYNLVLFRQSRRLPADPSGQSAAVQRFTYWQVAADYGAMFLLIHFTGGAASPFIFFFIFHIIFAAILLPRRSAYGFAGLAAAGMGLIAAAEYLGWIPHHALFFRGRGIDLAQQPFHVLVELSFFAASVFITAFSTTAVMNMLRKRIIALADLSEAVTSLNHRLGSLYAMIQAIGSSHRLDQILPIVTAELVAVMDVRAISVKLLSEDGKQLRYAASEGLPPEFVKDKVIEVARSPLNRRLIEGEPFVTGRLTQREMFQFGEDLVAVGFQSVLFVPLTVEERVIGILGAYCTRPERFGQAEVDFFRLAAGLVAIALENARAYESIEKLSQERSWFMMRVAHNLRAPLAAMLSILEVVRGGYQGELTAEQQEYLRRVDRRARSMIEMISEILKLGQSRNARLQPHFGPVDLNALAGRVRRTFQDETLEKGLSFSVAAAEGLPELRGDREQIEQMLENLVSNAIKYTPSGGRVGVAFAVGSDHSLRIEVSDNGIGIPKADRPRLFTEFFRADNAKAMEETGTGLGLTIVKDIVDQHGGRILVESEEKLGTIFVVHLPLGQGVFHMHPAAPAKKIEFPHFIDDAAIQGHLSAAAASGPDQAREVIAKARQLKGLELAEVAVLLQTRDSAVLEEMFHAAREVKEAIYGKRLVLFAPLYISNLCQNTCLYCAFRAGNPLIKRRALTQEEIADEVLHLIRAGQKRILLVAGEGYPQEGLDYIFKSIATIYATREGPGEVRRVNVNIAPLTVEEFRDLKACKIGTYQLFQETYHEATYRKLHVSGPKADYYWRLTAPGRAFEAGINDVGVGILFGLYDFRYEVLALLQHIRQLEKIYGVGPHTISMPRLEPAEGSDLAGHPPSPVADEDFKKIVAVLRLAVPYTGMIMTTRETPKMRALTFALGVSQLSAGSRTNPGGYTEGKPATAQFQLGDHRSLDEVIADMLPLGYIPSFCTACYRLGRTGQDFMDLAKPGLIKRFCLPNAILTFKEYLTDYASPQTRAAGNQALTAHLQDISHQARRTETEQRLRRIEQGERDLYF